MELQMDHRDQIEDHMVAIVLESKTEVRDRRDQHQDLTLMLMMF